MSVTNDNGQGFFVSTPVSLDAVLTRLEGLSQQPEFALQRETGLARALKPYLKEDGASGVLAALPQEVELANLSLLCDFYPEDGQLTLIEQLRDVVTEHIPDDERAWLDPLKHSYIDLLELVSAPAPGESLTLRSLGDGRTFLLPYEDFAKDLSPGHVLLTRVIHDPRRADSNEAVWGGCGLILSAFEGKALYEKTRDRERRMEMSSGELVLGEWQEFTKRFGHILLWLFADMRVAALVDAVAQIRYLTPDGEPYLSAIALYDHHDDRLFAEGLSAMESWQPEPQHTGERNAEQHRMEPRVWIQRSAIRNQTAMTARLTLTSSQLIVECDSPERLNDVKHSLARAFGFTLHFRGETLTPPYHEVAVADLQSGQPVTVVVSHEDDRALLNAFFEKAYLEWSDQPHGKLGGQTPRHAARMPATRHLVARLITEMEASDAGLRRGGKRAYDYNILRGHVGIEETE